MEFTRRGTKLIENLHALRHAKANGGALAPIEIFVRKLRHKILSMMTASDIDIDADIAKDVRLPHPNGVVIHGRAVVGEGSVIMQQVTLGTIREGLAPRLGARVYVGAGAKILGGVAIGDEAKIGANAVVVKDVPAGATATGIPAMVTLKGDEREKPRLESLG
ncbi:MAG: serine acetyltransferase [Parvularculaceae bacterium]